jgi:SAM-dependent methyltransferase
MNASAPTRSERAEPVTTEVRLLFDEQWSRVYRQIDERTGDAAFEHYGALLTTLTDSFRRPIDVLDIGCGTGRYFHRLRNVRQLLGLDLSAHMLEQARSPVRAGEICAQSIDLMCADLRSIALPDASFDFIYSVGVLGEYSPLDDYVLNTCRRLLRPAGMLLITAVDAASRVSVPENSAPSLLRRAMRKSWPLLPATVRSASNHWLSPCYLTRARLERLLAKSGFMKVDITPYPHSSGWLGTHFDCVAVNSSAD